MNFQLSAGSAHVHRRRRRHVRQCQRRGRVEDRRRSRRCASSTPASASACPAWPAPHRARRDDRRHAWPAATSTASWSTSPAWRPTAGTFVTVFPGDVASPPNASNLNLVPGQVRPNLAMVQVPTTGPAAGKIRLYNAFGTVDLLVDVVATYTPGSTGDSAAGRVLPLDAPMRVVDTRLIGGPLLGPNSRVHDFTADRRRGDAERGRARAQRHRGGCHRAHVPHACSRGARRCRTPRTSTWCPGQRCRTWPWPGSTLRTT